MYERVTHRIIRACMAILLAFMICAYPFVCAKKAEAIAPVVGAGAAAAALAAELGITTEALMTGLMVITAAGTGVYLLESSDYATSGVVLDGNSFGNLWNDPNISNPGYTSNWDSEYTGYKLGNGKSWDELTDEEKANWSNPAEYVQSQWLGYLLETGMIQEVTGGGGFEPTPEPDKNQNPDDNSRWNKARNVLTVLGVSGGAVALNDAVGWLGDTIGGGIHDLLFGSDGLGLPVQYSASVNGVSIPFVNRSITYQGVNVTDKWVRTYYGGGRSYYYTNFANYNGQFTNPRFESLNVSLIGSSWYLYTNSDSVVRIAVNDSTGAISTEPYNQFMPSGNSKILTSGVLELNPSWYGTYNFLTSNGQLITSLNSGSWSNPENVSVTNNYNYMNGTPSGLPSSVGDNNSWNGYINDASQPNEQGQIPAVKVPSVITDGLTYQDIVSLTDEDDVTPIPDDAPIPTPEPEPEPGLSPNAPEGFQDDLGESVERILRNPFDQVFPFCLIADFRDFIYIFLAGDTEIGQNTQRLRPQSLTVQSDVSTDELNGVHSIKLDLDESFEGFEVDIPLDPVHDLLAYSRIPLTVLFALALVYESFSFFLKRGGE